jgi:acyl carrier protein
MSSEINVPRAMRPSRDQVLADVIAIIGEHMGIAVETIRQTDALVNDLGCDSLDLVEIMMETEEHFGIPVPDEVAEQVQTVADVADGVLKLIDQLEAE